jgi:hypothetical protein
MPKETSIDEIELGAHQRCNIMCTILTLGMVPIEFVVGFGRMQMPINGQVFQHILKAIEVGKARNMAVEYMLAIPEKDRPKWLFFYGDDMLPPWDGFVKLYEEAEKNKWDCLTGLYFVKGEPPTPLTWRNDTVGRLRPGIDYKVGEVIWVDLTGLDFTLIRTSMLEKMTPPYFKTGPSLRSSIPRGISKYTDPKAIVLHTEDVWFYNKVKELGGKVGVHTGVRVAHIDHRSGMVY